MLRQHGQHAVREIHRGGTLARFIVQSSTGTHVVRNVSDSHQQAPATATHWRAVHSVVKVAGVFAVNRHQRQIAHIEPRTGSSQIHGLAEAARLAHHGGGEFCRQLVGDNSGLHSHVRQMLLVDAAGNTPHRVGMARRRLNEFRHHQRAGLRPWCLALAGRRHHHTMGKTTVARRDEPHPTFHSKATSDLTRIALQHFDHTAFWTATRINTREPHSDTVAVHHLAHLAGREEYIGRAIVGNQEAETIAMPHDTPHHQGGT